MDENNQKAQEEVLSQEAPVETAAKPVDEAAVHKDKYVRLLAEFDNMSAVNSSNTPMKRLL